MLESSLQRELVAAKTVMKQPTAPPVGEFDHRCGTYQRAKVRASRWRDGHGTDHDPCGCTNGWCGRGACVAPAASNASPQNNGHQRRRRSRATYRRTLGVRHLFAAYDLGADKIYGHIKTNKRRATFLAFCRYLCSLYPPETRIAIVLDNFSPHLSTKVDTRVGDWAAENNVELAYVPTNASWMNRIEANRTQLALRIAAINLRRLVNLGLNHNAGAWAIT